LKTLKLYYENPYINVFTAEVIEKKIIENKYHILLNQTAFFLGGGGQERDFGTIEGIEVVDIYEKEGNIYHVLEKELNKIHKVRCEIDLKHRKDKMYQHSAQHILSGAFFKLVNRNTKSVHFGNEISTVDIEGILNEQEVMKVEDYVNKIISDNIVIENFVPSKKELKKINVRRDLPQTDDEIRIIKIGALDVNACCGVHAKSTLELKAIVITKFEKNKGNTRIEFLAGDRAVNYLLKREHNLKRICNKVSCGEEELENSIMNLNEKISDLINENKKITEQLVDLESKKLIGECEFNNKVESELNNREVNLISKVYSDKNIEYLKKIANKLCEEDSFVVLLASNDKEKVNIIFACSKNLTTDINKMKNNKIKKCNHTKKGYEVEKDIQDKKNIEVKKDNLTKGAEELNMGELLRDTIKLLDGKGGGNKVFAQGGGKNNGNIENAIEYATRKVKEIIKNG
jgi:alanyl-tRNA synthetase